MTEPIRILLADDQALVRGALAALLDLESDITVVAEVGRGDEVLDAVGRSRPDVALLDVEMPGLDGISVAAHLHRAHPTVRILMVTTFGRPGYLRRAIDAGASGPPEKPSGSVGCDQTGAGTSSTGACVERATRTATVSTANAPADMRAPTHRGEV